LFVAPQKDGIGPAQRFTIAQAQAGFSVQTSNGKLISSGGGDHATLASGVGPSEMMQIDGLDIDLLAPAIGSAQISNAKGEFLNVGPDGSVKWGAEAERFEAVALHDGSTAFRAPNSKYLAVNADGELVATSDVPQSFTVSQVGQGFGIVASNGKFVSGTTAKAEAEAPEELKIAGVEPSLLLGYTPGPAVSITASDGRSLGILPSGQPRWAEREFPQQLQMVFDGEFVGLRAQDGRFVNGKLEACDTLEHLRLERSGASFNIRDAGGKMIAENVTLGGLDEKAPPLPGSSVAMRSSEGKFLRTQANGKISWNGDVPEQFTVV
jgi:hypothetical protein